MDRDPVDADFVGKTIVRFDGSSCNIWRFAFADGTALAIEAEIGGLPALPFMQVCEECAHNWLELPKEGANNVSL